MDPDPVGSEPFCVGRILIDRDILCRDPGLDPGQDLELGVTLGNKKKW